LTNICLCKFKNNPSTLRFFALHQSISQRWNRGRISDSTVTWQRQVFLRPEA
jgi:hypothetical protein